MISTHSSLAFQRNIHIIGCDIDLGCRGNVQIGMYSQSIKSCTMDKGDHITHLRLEKAFIPSIKVVDTLNETEHAAQGFSSTERREIQLSNTTSTPQFIAPLSALSPSFYTISLENV